MSTNPYDNLEFLDGYLALRRSTLGLAGAPEWPALSRLLPPLAGTSVLDLGCGLGWFSRWAREQGARRLLAVDGSHEMLARAHGLSNDPAIEYRHMDLEVAEFVPDAFDLAFSSLALHYLANPVPLLAAVHRALRPGAPLVCSIEHPIFSAPRQAVWATDSEGSPIWPLDRYADEGPRSRQWFVPGVIKHHRTLGSWVNLVIAAGFSLEHLEEWAPSAQQVADTPELARERERPMFLLLVARR